MRFPKFRECGAVILASVLFHLPSYASTYYVDNSGSPACGDSYAGTESAPWCTVSTGINKLNPGDLLYVKNGIYNGAFTITGKSGTSDAGRITIKAYPGHVPVLRGPGYNSGRVKFVGSKFVTFSGFEITFINQGFYLDNCSDFIAENLIIHDVGQEAFHVNNYSSNVIAQGNRIYNTRRYAYNGEGFYIGTGSGGPKDGTHHIIIRNNVVYNTMDEGVELKPGTHDCIVDNNDISDTGNFAAIEVDEANSGVQSYGSNPNHIIRNNTIHGIKKVLSAQAGIRAGTGCSVYNNVIYDLRAGIPGIKVDNLNGDSYLRRIYFNTVDLPPTDAVKVYNAPIYDLKDNIGPTNPYNLATLDSFYVDKSSANYHLASSAAPIAAGIDLRAYVSTDKDGIPRSSTPDIGAYSYRASIGKIPNPPESLQVK